MILARTLPAAVAPSARQAADTSATGSRSDPTETPFGGVLDRVTDGSARRNGSQSSKDGASTPDGQAWLGRSASDLGPLAASPVALSRQVDAYPLAPLAVASAQPTMSAADGGTDSTDLASVLAALAPDGSEPLVKSGAVAATPRTKSTGKSAPGQTDGAPGSNGGSGDLTSLSSFLGLPPTVYPQAEAGSAENEATSMVKTLGLTGKNAGQAANGSAAAAAALDQIAGAQTAVGDRAAASLGASASRAHVAGSGSDGFAASLAPMVKSLTVETQLTPSVSLSPMQQVTATVQKLAAGAATDVALPQASPLPPSRTMTLVLEPQDLGTVTIKMQLRGSSLDLQLDVDSAQTLGLLSRDKETLAAAMASQDYQIGTLTMRSSDTQTSSQGSDHGSRPHDQAASEGGNGDASQYGQASQGGSGLDGGSRQDASAGRGQSAPDEGQSVRSAGAAADAPAATGGLYI